MDTVREFSDIPAMLRTMRCSTHLLLSVAGLVATVALAQQPAQLKKPTNPRQVVFVGEHGAAKSVSAAAYFNELARERGLPERASARGTPPDPAYSPVVVQGLKD